TGRRMTVSGQTKQEAIRNVAKLKRERDSGMYGNPDGELTFREYCKIWLENHGELSPKTAAGYRSIYRNHLDGIGDVKLDALTPGMLQEHYAKIRKERAPTTVRNIHRLFHVVLEEAVSHNVIPRNPSAGIRGMKAADREMLVMRGDEIPGFLLAAKQHRFHALWRLAISTGMREAELLGLRWQDIDFAQGIIRVRQEVYRVERHFVCKAPKSATSKRDLPLVPEVAIDLQKWRIEQSEEKRLAGDAWKELFDDLVFLSPLGTPIAYDNILRQFRQVIRSAGLNMSLRVHDMRHTFATLLLEQGVHVLIVSRLLGHSSVNITLRVYGHVTLRMSDQARVQINQIFGSQDTEQPKEIFTSDTEKKLLHDVLHDVMQSQA
ncbi:MAG: site-specific integrase, partial [Verrucomicrobia bacterium]|nr:site-specific integrase [Verrucomicrobiota bacterium]